MGQIRKSYTAALKAKVVQEALAGEKTLSQIASTYGIHANMITKWKQIAVQAMPETLCLGNCYYLYPHERRVAVFGGCSRLVFTLYCELGD